MVRRLLYVCVMVLAGATASAQDNAASPGHEGGGPAPTLLQFSVSPPVRHLPSAARGAEPPKPIAVRRPFAGRTSASASDPVVQTSAPGPAVTETLGQWEGLGAGYPGFSITAVPPDPNIAVGPNHVVQWVNNAFVVFDKQGQPLLGPIGDDTFWGPDSTCDQLGGFSDPIVQYDRIADRWLIGEVAIPLFPGLFGQYAQCFAVSTSPDPTGAYYMWAYGFGTNINDYPKIGVWPDGYYVTWNIFSASEALIGPEACAFSRSDMIGGVAAPAFVCFNLNSSYASLLPSDLDGRTLPPAGSPNFLMDVDASSGAVHLWKFHADYATPGNSTFTGVSLAGVAPFTSPCLTTQDCVPQPATAQKLDALGDRLMYRLAYRNFGDHASLVTNHSVLTPGGNIGVRWYEVRDPGGTPAIYQQGTFAPDADNRWMGSIAMDQSGDIALGYSVASASTYPSIRFTGWETGSPFGELQAETSAVVGTGSQTGHNRWGDYSAMRIDPSDDCTFFYTQEYLATTSASDWSTRIISFKFPGCGASLAATTTDLTSSPSPSAFGDPVTFSATISPAAATGIVEFRDGAAVLGTAPVSSGGASLTTSALAAGSHSITAVYSGDSAYASSTSPAVTQVVNGGLITTTTSLTSSPDPSTFGQAVALVATVMPASGTATPTGTATFRDGATVLGSAPLDANGVATLLTSALAAGSHDIGAQYGGDAAYAGSSSVTVTQTVAKANTTTTLTSNRNPSNSGSPVTFTATVSPSAATGTVSFFDGTTSIGTATLSGGVAALTKTLAAGTHSITAQYGGDANFAGSTSAPLTQTVKKKGKK